MSGCLVWGRGLYEGMVKGCGVFFVGNEMFES